MKKYTKETTTCVTKKFKHMKCDICGHKAVMEDDWSCFGPSAGYGAYKTSVEMELGIDEHTCYYTDICHNCFIEKLIPFLTSLGSKRKLIKKKIK